MIVRFFRGLLSLVVTAIVLGLSLLPLSALLLLFPAVDPTESVLSDSTGREGHFRQGLRRLFALLTGFVVLITLLGVSVEAVTLLRENTGTAVLSERGQFSSISKTLLFAPATFLGKTDKQRDEKMADYPEAVRTFLKTPLSDKLPPAAVAYWPLVFFLVYLLDIGLLLAVGKVPLRYNLRNLRVRWLTNAMTLVAFTFVVGLLVMLLAFVCGMNNLTENTGVPGNVFVLSDGATDELFSNLGYGDLDNVEREAATLDAKDRPLAEPVRVAKTKGRDGREVALASRETYYSINQPIPKTTPPRRRFMSPNSKVSPGFIVGRSVSAAKVLAMPSPSTHSTRPCPSTPAGLNQRPGGYNSTSWTVAAMSASSIARSDTKRRRGGVVFGIGWLIE